MRSILAAVAIALLTTFLALQAVPSVAQPGARVDESKRKSDEAEAVAKAKERKAFDGSYKSAIDRLPDQKYDPWRNLR